MDPARHTQVYADLAHQYHAQIRQILDTHCHADHISGGTKLATTTGGTYWVASEEMQGSSLPFRSLTDGMTFRFGAAVMKVMTLATPGHTPGSTSFLVNDKYLLAGDTIFISGLGRPDLGGKAREWAGLLFQTVTDKLDSLDDSTVILPAHFSDPSEINASGFVGETYGHLREQNPLLDEKSEDTFTEAVIAQIGLTPPNYTTIVDVNRGNRKLDEVEARELEIGPNRCAVKHLAG
ncbi:MAG: MBL fold metallo-hydrolase [Firmicutes bacterium]|nr:MBL fold metallo-hydrolase [Bacillota bacterium]